MKNILEIKKLNFKYNNNIIFKDFNLSVKENDFISIAGNNTSGKTTLIKLINGSLPSDKMITIGYSYVSNDRVHDHSKELGTVYGSNFNYFLFDDVYKELAFPLENLSIDPADIEKRIIELSKFFCVNKLLDKKIHDLTKSEKQQLQLVISLLHEPKLLLLDNPFSMMDRITKRNMMKKLKEYQASNNLTIILATTNLEETIDSNYLYIINKGGIVIEGKPLNVLKEDTLINRLGLEIPFMVDLSLKFEFYQLLDDIELDIDRMVNTLWK